MKKIWLVVANAVSDGDDCGIGTEVFEKKDNALRYFNKLIAEEEECIDFEYWEVERTDYSFCAWLDGCYCDNHSIIEIRELTLN